jgi:hypothetical protein
VICRGDSQPSVARRLGVVTTTTVVGCLVLAGLVGVLLPSAAHAFAIKPGSFKVTSSTQRAGAHEDLTTAFKFVHNAEGATDGNVKTTSIELPPGFIGSNTAVPTCTASQLVGSGSSKGGECPPDTQVGTISFSLALLPEFRFGVPVTEPLYSMEVTSPGIAAMFGFNFNGIIVQNLPIIVRPGDSGLTVTSEAIQGIGEVSEVSVTVWGVPAATSHDAERGLHCDNGVCLDGNESVSIPPKPFLSNPTSCATEPLIATLRTNDWQDPEKELTETTEIAPIVECERVPFDPTIEVQPSTRSAESPTGLAVSLVVPQSWENPLSLSTSNLKDTKLTLPVGYTVNPGAGSGLGVCTPAQYEAETAGGLPGSGCPEESKIGAVEVETPVLAEKLMGAVYVAKPFDNPFNSLLGLYIVVKSPARGIIVKLAGHIEPDPVTGQLVTTFDENPQVPFSKFTLKLRQGATSPLVSPPVCGTYTAEAQLTPWSDPLVPQLVDSSFQIENGIGGRPCPTGGVPPFKPQVVSGTQNNAGGSYSPFYLRILRADGEQELTRFSTTLPPGLTGNLTGIPFCPDAAVEAAKGRTGPHGGEEEESSPSCPAASQIGHTIVSAGVGTVLAQTPGKVYLAGPYHGVPLSIVSITSAKVGPFDLGTVVIRFALNINPSTAQVEVSASGSDPIPHIIKGIVVHVREIRVYMNREKFILNPTNCSPLSITNTIDGAGADFTNPADQVPVSVSSPFQAADCSTLQFKPTFKVTTSGKTSRSNGASLTAKLTYPKAPFGSQANIARVKVDLPKQLPSRLTTLQKACTAAQFNANPAGCPAASFIGHAKAITPILPVPLEGPAIFVSHGGEAFPSLIVVLQGYGVTIDLVGSTFISKAGITSSTFKTVPDQPVTSFELTLPEGKFSALAANGNLCTSKLKMPTEFVAQNGAKINESTPIGVTGCPKTKALTRAQKLTKALKACKKQAKAKRAACAKQARKQFAPLKKKQAKKK